MNLVLVLKILPWQRLDVWMGGGAGRVGVDTLKLPKTLNTHIMLWRISVI